MQRPTSRPATLYGVCLFGGAFDPPHRTHRRLVTTALEALAVESLVVVPAGDHPHKRGGQLLAAHHRLALCELAFAGIDRVRIDDRELRREPTAGPSYTLETVRSFRDELGPEPPIYWLIGADNLPKLPTWHRHHALLAEACIVTIPRRGHPVGWDSFAGLDLTPAERCHLLDHCLPGDADEISATTVRERLARGEPTPELDDSVAAYIAQHGLYRWTP